MDGDSEEIARQDFGYREGQWPRTFAPPTPKTRL